jgi:hypothetical protein
MEPESSNTMATLGLTVTEVTPVPKGSSANVIAPAEPTGIISGAGQQKLCGACGVAQRLLQKTGLRHGDLLIE